MTDYDDAKFVWLRARYVGTAMRTLTDAVKYRSAERAKDRLPEFLAAERDVLRAHEELLRLGVDVPLLGKHVVDAADLSSLHVTNVTTWRRNVLHPRPAAVPEAPEPPVAAEPCETCGGNGFLVCKPCNGGGVGSGGDECSDCRGAGGKPCPDCAPPGADAK